MNLTAPLPARADADPVHVALHFEGDSVTYAEVDDLVARYAAVLYGAGVRRGDRVLLALPNIPEFHYLVHAAWRLGAVVVPMNPRSTPGEIDAVAAQARPVFSAVGHAPPMSRIRHFADVSVDGDTLAVVAFTSGTTGAPKGVMLSHDNIAIAMEQFAARGTLGAEDHILQTLPSASIACSITGVLLAWHLGATATLAPGFEVHAFAHILRERRPTFFGSVPTMHYDLLASDLDLDTTQVKFAIFGGAPSADSLQRSVASRFGLALKQAYGMTESPGVFVVDPPSAPMRATGIGVALDHVSLTAIGDVGQVLDAGTVGQLRVGPAPTGPAAGVYRPFLGYWRDNKATNATIADGCVHTGDLGTVDADGVVTIVGREKDLIIRGGNNIAPAELEGMLLADQRVVEAYVIGVPDARLGQVPHAVVVLRGGDARTADALRDLVNDRVAPYKRVAAVAAVAPDSLPRTPMGKVIKARVVWPG